MRKQNKMALLTAVIAALYGLDAKADKPGAGGWYFGLGWETPGVIDLDAMYQLRSSVRDALPVEYLRPLEEESFEEHKSPFMLYAGYEINNWLGVELAAHAIDSSYKLYSEHFIRDPELSTPGQLAVAEQTSEFNAATYSLTLIPRWDYNEYLSVFGRFGLGYADTKLSTEITSVADERVSFYIRKKGVGFMPVIGLGVQLLQFMRLECMLREDLPIGDTTTSIRTGAVLTFQYKRAFGRY